MTYTIENKYLNTILIIVGVFLGLLMGIQFLGDGAWLYKVTKVLIMFVTMCAVFYLLNESNIVRLTQTGIHLPFHKEISYTSITSYEETTRITSANGRTVSRPVIAVTTATGVTRVPVNGDKKIIIDAIEAGRSGNGSELLSILHRSGNGEVSFRNTTIRYSFVLVVSIIPLLIMSFMPKSSPTKLQTGTELTRKAAQGALMRKDYTELYQITKNHIVQNGIITKDDCDLYDLLQVAEKNLDITDRFPKPPACK